MIRQAQPGEGGMVYERLQAEMQREGFDLIAPAAGAIEADIAAGQQWYIDDDDPTVIAHALKGMVRDNGREVEGVLVPHVWNKSERDEEVLRFLANDLLRLYGDLPATYPGADAPGARVQKADAIIKPRVSGGKRLTTLGEGARLLNARVERAK